MQFLEILCTALTFHALIGKTMGSHNHCSKYKKYRQSVNEKRKSVSNTQPTVISASLRAYEPENSLVIEADNIHLPHFRLDSSQFSDPEKKSPLMIQALAAHPSPRIHRA